MVSVMFQLVEFEHVVAFGFEDRPERLLFDLGRLSFGWLNRWEMEVGRRVVESVLGWDSGGGHVVNKIIGQMDSIITIYYYYREQKKTNTSKDQGVLHVLFCLLSEA